MWIRISTVAVAFVLAAAPVRADTLNVPGDSATIQGAIALAADGDTILVAPGTYDEALNLQGKQLVIEGTGGAAVTIVDGGGAAHTVLVDGAEPAGTTLRGLTITGGVGGQLLDPVTSAFVFGGGGVGVGVGAHLTLDDCTITGNAVTAPGSTWGGGVLGLNAEIVLTGCTLSGNQARQGAALTTWGSCQITMSDCSITGNTCSGSSSSAAALSLLGNGLVEDCTITGNTGHGLWRTNHSTTVRRCEFSGNSGWGYIAFAPDGTEVTECRFLGNGLGGARFTSPSELFANHRAERCVFAEGDLLSAQNDSTALLRVVNCSFDGTHVSSAGGTVLLNNSIFRGMVAPVVGPVHTLVVEFCDVEGGAGGSGNIDADPLWADAPAHDYALLAGSPCIDAGDESAPLDPDGSIADIGAVPFFHPWLDLGGGVAGSTGVPQLTGMGLLEGGDPVALTLSGAPAFKPTFLLIGATQLNVPFKGGQMWPYPQLVIAGVPTNGLGGYTLSATWPAALPPGFKVWMQVWFKDTSAVAGFAGSNGLRATTQ